MLQSTFAFSFQIEDVLTNRISGQSDLFLWEESLHALISHTNRFGFFSEVFVGDSCIGVLFLDQSRNLGSLCCVKDRPAGKSTNSNHSIGLEVFQDLLRLPKALQQPERKFQIASERLR